ncbi:metallopeptidase family M24 [Phlyctema vagabunda]|uniref:Metallopeptidase family M24 n=1 Tax=Phlyctema vagabunda TaxID=108571 RepID=A0ABR4PXI1_9HELO
MISEIHEKGAGQPLLGSEGGAMPSKSISRMGTAILLVQALFLLSFIGIIPTPFVQTQNPHLCPLSAKGLEACSWKTLQDHVSLLDVAPITEAEFLQRQSVLAVELDKAGFDAFIAEPSASTSYFANVSSSFELSERPFLVIIDKKGQFSYLAPKFELGRIAGLSMVYKDKTVIEWPEEKSPYEVLKAATGYKKVMLDEHVRYMIASGLQAAGIEVAATSETIQSIRAIKSDAEIAILQGINAFTLQLVRAMQKCIRIGMSQETITTAAASLFAKAGVGKDFWAIVLFGEQAASPHGGSSGKILSDGEFVLMDIGSSLYDYGSDVTRTILPDESKVSDELMEIWKLVHAAQAAAIDHMLVNETCSVVDNASRKVIADAGYGPYFTHRLGHGLGLEMHEHPYLNGANSERLKVGEVVTNEPGVYVTTEEARNLDKDIGFGVRLEDPILVSADGGVPTTGRTAISPYEP